MADNQRTQNLHTNFFKPTGPHATWLKLYPSLHTNMMRILNLIEALYSHDGKNTTPMDEINVGSCTKVLLDAIPCRIKGNITLVNSNQILDEYEKKIYVQLTEGKAFHYIWEQEVEYIRLNPFPIEENDKTFRDTMNTWEEWINYHMPLDKFTSGREILYHHLTSQSNSLQLPDASGAGQRNNDRELQHEKFHIPLHPFPTISEELSPTDVKKLYEEIVKHDEELGSNPLMGYTVPMKQTYPTMLNKNTARRIETL